MRNQINKEIKVNNDNSKILQNNTLYIYNRLVYYPERYI